MPYRTLRMIAIKLIVTSTLAPSYGKSPRNALSVDLETLTKHNKFLEKVWNC